MTTPLRTAPLTRRRWMAAAAATGLAWSRIGRADDPATPDPLAEVRERAAKAGLGPLEVRQGERYVGIGDAPASFMAAALEICEDLADDYLQHMRARKLPADVPADKLAIVALSSPDRFARYLGLDDAGAVRGIYDLDSNRLVICDNRGESNPMAERANTVALFHEATHQLTFNTGLLNRQGDVPKAISEGLATYGEVRRPKGQARVGAVNRERLAVLAQLRGSGGQLIPVARLLVEDELLDEPATQQIAYSQSWLLAHSLMQSGRAGRFRAYLDAIRPRTTADHRLEDVRDHLGDPDGLDRALAAHANRLLR